MSTTAHRRRAPKQAVDKTTALELLISALTYVKSSGMEVRASNLSSGLAIVISNVSIDPDGRRILPVVANPPADDFATTGKQDSGKGNPV